MIVRRFSISRFRVLFVATFLVISPLAPNASSQMTAREFETLPIADKRTVLVDSLQKWNEAVHNVRASSVTRTYNVTFKDGVAGSRIEGRDFGRHECEFRRNEDDYWAAVKWFMPDATDTPTLQVETSWDAASGTTRSIARHGKATGVYGAISTREDKMLQCAHFLYWFSGTFDDEDHFPIKFMLKHKDAIVFDGITEDGSQVRLSLVVKSARDTKTDTRAILVDPRKGFMPTWMHRRKERRPAPHVAVSFSETDLTVDRMEQIDGVWFPVRIRTVAACTQSVKRAEATVFETEASEIALGTVRPADMEVTFPDDMKVHDLVAGKWTIAGIDIGTGGPD